MRPLKPLERWGRRRISRILRALLVGGIEKRPLPPDPRSILVVRIDDRLGNLVLLEPLLTSLSERFPGARVELLASRTFADVFESHAAVSRIWRAEKKRYIRNPLALLLFFRRLRRCAFDVAIDASHPVSFSLSSAVASALAGAERRAQKPGARLCPRSPGPIASSASRHPARRDGITPHPTWASSIPLPTRAGGCTILEACGTAGPDGGGP